MLGAGNIAHSFVKDFPLMQNAELIAVAANDTARARDFAALYNISRALCYDELYNSDEIDAVYISTTHNFILSSHLNASKMEKQFYVKSQ